MLTGRYFVDDSRRSYQEEKQHLGDMPETPLAERYFDPDATWERSADFVDRHK